MNTNKLKTILAKLGIFRSGTVSWKGNAKDRPIEIMSDSVFKKSDFTNKEDIKKIKEMLSSKKGAKLFTGIVILNVLLILLLILVVGFNFGTVLAIAMIFLFRKMYLNGKLASTVSLIGVGFVLTFVVFITISLFTNSEEGNYTDNEDKAGVDEINMVIQKVSEDTETSEEVEEKVLVKGSTEGTVYYKGKGIGAKDIDSDLIRKINPLMKQLGFEVTSKGEVGGMQQLGGESYSKDNIFCDAMSGVYSKSFTKDTSSFTFNCAYLKDGASDYMSASEIELDY